MGLTRVVNVRRARYDVYVGRPSMWGNPYSHQEGTLAQFKVATREEAIVCYERWLMRQPMLLAMLPAVRGKILGCHCHPLPCHGHVIARFADYGVPRLVE